MYHPFLIGKRIYLRGLEKSDISGNYFQWFNDKEICKFNGHTYFPNNIIKMETFIDSVHKEKSQLVLAIIAQQEDFHFGNISLQNIDWITGSAEYAIIIGEKEYWGRGYAKEASDLIIEHGFISLNLHRIYCGTSEDNYSMQKLAEYMGMKKEGVRREAFYKNGKYKDIYEYGILKNEYLDKTTKVI